MRGSLLAVVASFVGGVSAQDWPGWRGPAGNGIAPEQDVPLRWDGDTNIKWRIALARPGNGSPVVSGDRVFLTLAEDDEGKRRSLYCFDRADGREVWVRTVEYATAMPTHATNPHCSTTPAANGERVVVWHVSAGLFCYGFDGTELWRRDLGEFRHQWGHGTSPVLHDGAVILHSGPGAQSFVAAFDLETGKTRWRVDEPNHLTPDQIKRKRLAGSWCTPLIHRVGERDLVLCGHPTRIVAYDAADGDVVWWCTGVTCARGDLVYSSPLVAGDVCHVKGGYEGPSIGVRLDGEGDVTRSHRAWHHPEKRSNCGSGVYVGGVIYLPDIDGFVRCIDPEDGAVRWRERLGRGQIWGSIVAVGDRLYLTNQRGTTHVFAANPERLEVLASNALRERTNSTPAVAGGEIFLRTHKSLLCVSATASAERDGEGR